MRILCAVLAAAFSLSCPAWTQTFTRGAVPSYSLIPGLLPHPGLTQSLSPSLSQPTLSFSPLSVIPAPSAPLVAHKDLLASPPRVAAPDDFSDLLRARLWKPSGSGASSVDLSPSLRPPANQGRYRGTCSVFAAAGLGEYLIRAVKDEDFDISEQHLYYSAKKDFLTTPELQVYKTIDGLAGFVAVEALKGPLLDEKHWHYQDQLPKKGARSQGLSLGLDADGPNISGLEPLRLAKKDDFTRFTGTPPAGHEKFLRKDLKFKPVAMDRRDIKRFLAQEKKPVVFNIMVYFDAIDNKTGRFRGPTDEERRRCRESEDGCGGHTILITGYDAASKEYIFRNSWGDSWGAGGYGRLPESYVADDCEMCGYLKDLPAMSESNRKMVVNGAHGWSAELE